METALIELEVIQSNLYRFDNSEEQYAVVETDDEGTDGFLIKRIVDSWNISKQHKGLLVAANEGFYPKNEFHNKFSIISDRIYKVALL